MLLLLLQVVYFIKGHFKLLVVCTNQLDHFMLLLNSEVMLNYFIFTNKIL